MNHRNIFTLAAATTLATAVVAHGGVIDFESLSVGSYDGTNGGTDPDFTAPDFTVTSSDGASYDFNSTRGGTPQMPNRDETTNIVTPGNPGNAVRSSDFGETLRITLSNGGLFGLDSLDAVGPNNNDFDATVFGLVDNVVVAQQVISNTSGGYMTYSFGTSFDSVDQIAIDVDGGINTRFGLFDNIDVSATVIPEPASAAGIGLLGLLGLRRIRRRR